MKVLKVFMFNPLFMFCGGLFFSIAISFVNIICKEKPKIKENWKCIFKLRHDTTMKTSLCMTGYFIFSIILTCVSSNYYAYQSKEFLLLFPCMVVIVYVWIPILYFLCYHADLGCFAPNEETEEKKEKDF